MQILWQQYLYLTYLLYNTSVSFSGYNIDSDVACLFIVEST